MYATSNMLNTSMSNAVEPENRNNRLSDCIAKLEFGCKGRHLKIKNLENFSLRAIILTFVRNFVRFGC